MKFETPYVREARDPSKSRLHLTTKDTNYSDYDIFKLPINLYPFIRSDLTVDLEEGPLYPPEKEDDENSQGREEDYVTRYYVVVTDEDGGEPDLSEDEVRMLEEAIEEVCGDYSNSIFVCSYDTKFYTEDEVLVSSSWANAMLSYMPFFEGRQLIPRDTGCYIFIDPSEDYMKIYNHYQNFLNDWMASKYERGFLPSTFTEQFVKDWKLVKEKGLFRVGRKNPVVMGEDPIEFFQHRVKIYEGDMMTTRDFTSKEEGDEQFYVWTTPTYSARGKKTMATLLLLNHYTFTVDQNRFHVVVSGYPEASVIAKTMLKKMTLGEKQLEEMEQTDVVVPYEHPYEPTLTY